MLVKDGFLTKAELISYHGKSGNILHARNPYNRQFDYKEHDSLLNCHQIRLLDQDFFYLINMKEEGGDHVHYYKFQEVEGQPNAPGNRAQAAGS